MMDNVAVSVDRIVGNDAQCGCNYSDAWRCAVDRRLNTISCSCPCHRREPDVLEAKNDDE